MATYGTLLGGRVHYQQPAAGYRTGIEPVLLAASVSARDGERVLEAGTGAGAGLLCLSARVPGVAGIGIEIDPALADLARANIGANGRALLRIETSDVTALRPPPLFHHAFCNPPWHDRASTPSPCPQRLRARQATEGLLERWCVALAGVLHRRGTLTVLVPAAQLGGAMMAARRAGLGGLVLMPLWPKAGRAAKLILLRGTKDSRGPDQVLPGLVLHEAGGAFTPAANAILRDGAALEP